MKKNLIALLGITLLASLQLHAQEEDNRYNESVVVKGTYRPVIEQAQKISFPATITDTLGRINHAFQYHITPTRLRAHYEPTRIRAARVVGEPATRLYNNYLRVGMGTYWTPLADLYWSSTRDRLKTYGVRLNHLSSWGKITNYGPNHYGNTDLTLFGKYIVKDQLQLFTDLNYEHDHHLYYGGLTDSAMLSLYGFTRDSFSTKDYRASYNTASWRIGLRNMELDPNRLGYSATANLSDLWTIYGVNELGLTLEGDIHYGFTIDHQYKGVAYLRAGWDYTDARLNPASTMPNFISSYVYPIDSVQHTLNTIRFNPFADFMMRGFQIHAGLTTGWRNTDINEALALYILPDVVVSTKLMREKLVLSLSATGGVDNNTLNNLRQINPYLRLLSIAAPTLHYDFALHGRWTLSKKLEANADVQYSILNNDVIFTPHMGANGLCYYTPLSTDDNRLTFGAEVAFVNDELITLRASGHYYIYWWESLDFSSGNSSVSMHAPFYRPNWDAQLTANLNYHEKWYLQLEAGLVGKTTGYHYTSLPMRYGVATQVEYRHNRALSFFLRADNLAFQRYLLWDNYPSQRALFLAGLTYTIPHK